MALAPTEEQVGAGQHELVAVAAVQVPRTGTAIDDRLEGAEPALGRGAAAGQVDREGLGLLAGERGARPGEDLAGAGGAGPGDPDLLQDVHPGQTGQGGHIVPPGSRPPPANTPGTSAPDTPPQVTASLRDFAVSLACGVSGSGASTARNPRTVSLLKCTESIFVVTLRFVHRNCTIRAVSAGLCPNTAASSSS